MVSSARLVRHLVGAVWLLAVIALLGLAAATHLAGFLDRQLYIVRGASMEPAIPLGALIAVGEAAPEQLAVGDIVTVRTESGTVVTHRIIEVHRAADGELMLRTQGDASPAADVALFPVAAVIGEVDAYAPWLGYVLAFLSTPSGLVSVIAALGALLVTRWSLDGRGTTVSGEAHRPAVQPAITAGR